MSQSDVQQPTASLIAEEDERRRLAIPRVLRSYANAFDRGSSDSDAGPFARRAADEIERLREENTALSERVRKLTPPPVGSATTHWDGCWLAWGHHTCALERLQGTRVREKDLIRRVEEWVATTTLDADAHAKLCAILVDAARNADV